MTRRARRCGSHVRASLALAFPSAVLMAVVTLSGCVPDRSTEAATSATREEVYVVRARPTGPERPVTSFCNGANFPATYPVTRERSYEYLSTTSRSVDGLLVNAAVQIVGGFRGCYSARIDGKTFSYGKGTVAGIPFTIRGDCTFAPDRSPRPDVTPYTCDYVHSELPSGYVGGQSLWNGMFTTDESYLATTIATIRLWRTP
jgi:hypothetical protein